nr:hypothetical protein [Tanacetum cinerariifolium]
RRGRPHPVRRHPHQRPPTPAPRAEKAPASLPPAQRAPGSAAFIGAPGEGRAHGSGQRCRYAGYLRPRLFAGARVPGRRSARGVPAGRHGLR